jgi:hypothetical protein
MRTATTTPDVLAQPISPEVLRWEDKTTQLCHCLLRKLFGSPKPLVQGSRVIIHGMKTEWLNGAEGILGTLHPNGRHYVHLLLPQSAVAQVAGGTVPIPLDNLMWIPGATDVVTVRRLQQAAGGGSKGAQVTPPQRLRLNHISDGFSRAQSSGFTGQVPSISVPHERRQSRRTPVSAVHGAQAVDGVGRHLLEIGAVLGAGVCLSQAQAEAHHSKSFRRSFSFGPFLHFLHLAPN